MHRNLRTFLDLLQREKEILTIEAEVDPYLEAAEVHRRVIEQGEKLCFLRVYRETGLRWPVDVVYSGDPDAAKLSRHRRGVEITPKSRSIESVTGNL